MTTPGGERVAVDVVVRDRATQPLRRIERQARDTGSSLRRMDRDGAQPLSGGLQRIQRNAAGATRSLVRLGVATLVATGVTLLATALAGLGAGAVAATAGLSPLLATVAALPAVLGAGISALVTSKAAFAGIGEALKVATDPNATVEQFAQAMAGLSPQARMLVGELALVKEEWKSVQRAAQGGLFPGVISAVRDVRSLMPVAERAFAQTGAALGGVARQAGQLVSSAVWRRDLGTIADRNARLVSIFGRSLLFLVDTFRHIIIAAGPMTQRLALAFEGWTKYVRATTAAGRASGRLERFFNRAGDVLLKTLRVLGNFTVGLFNVFRGGVALGNQMGDSIARIAVEFRAWTESTRGQERIRRFFREAQPVVYSLLKLVGALAVALGSLGGNSDLAPLIDQVRRDLLPAVTGLVGAFGGPNGLGPALVSAATGLALFLTELAGSPLKDFVQLVGDALQGVGEFVAEHQTFAGIIASWYALNVAIKLVTFSLGRLGIAAATVGLVNFGRAAAGASVASTGLAAVLGRKVLMFRQLAAMSSRSQAALFMLRAPLIPLAAALGITAGALLGVVAAAAAVVGAVVLLWAKWEAFTSWLSDHKIAFAIISILVPVVPMIVGITWALRGLADLWGDFWGGAGDALGPVKRFLEDVWGTVQKIGSWLNEHTTDKAIKGYAQSIGNALVPFGSPFGDTARPRAGGPRNLGVGLSRNHDRAMRVHAALAGPGQKVTSGVRFHSLGSMSSDHATGKAWDVTGSNLGRYAQGVRAMGGFAEMHGSGESRHLHAAIGDTPRPRAPMPAAGGNSVVVEVAPGAITIVGTELSEDELKQAIADGIAQYGQERLERASHDGGL